MKIIVAGSCGLIGSQLVKDLGIIGDNEIISADIKTGQDFSNEEFAINFFKETHADALVNCIALNDHVDSSRNAASFLDISLKHFTDVLRVNIIAMYSVTREFIKNNNKGTIINFSSIYGFKSPSPHLYKEGHKDPAYCASKAAVSLLTKYFAVHAPKFKINCIVPGGILANQPASFVDQYVENIPAGRMMNVSEISGLVRFLLSEDSNYCTGGDFFIDGGWSIR